MNWALLGGSLVAILALAGLAALLRLGGTALADDEQAAEIAEQSLPGFAARRVWRGEDGRAAVVGATDGRFAFVRAHGAQFVCRPVPLPAHVETSNATVSIDSGERLLGRFVITLANASEARELTQVLATPPHA